jgi:hypothetical protein
VTHKENEKPPALQRELGKCNSMSMAGLSARANTRREQDGEAGRIQVRSVTSIYFPKRFQLKLCRYAPDRRV